MCSLGRRAAAPGFGAGAAAFLDLDRRRGVAAAAMAPAATSRHNAGEQPTRRARASDEAPARKRGRHAAVDPAASSALRIRMDAELVALQGLLKRARLLPRSGAAPLAAEKKCAPPAKPPRPAVHRSAAAKNPIAREVPSNSNKQRPAEEAPAAAKEHPVQRVADNPISKAEVPKKRRLEEEKELVARAAAREESRRMLVEMEKAALPDERIYPEEMEALGIPFEFLVTRTWKQACLDYHAKKLEFVAV